MVEQQNYHFSSELQQFLVGRSLLLQEIPFDKDIIDEHIAHGFIKTTPGIEMQKQNFKCHRCSNQVKRLFARFPCARCQTEEGCYYCRSCIMMGRVSSCTPLYEWIGPELKWGEFGVERKSYLSWTGALSKSQQLAAKAIVQAVKEKKDLLVWAVTGAGKTELLFHGMDVALLRHNRVCIATPRTDVVLELAPRLKKVFPDVPIAVLYGGSEDRHTYAPLTISTTHQLLRFKQAFDVIVVDEVDAFPYSMDHRLQWAVDKSSKPIASKIYLTATPSETWQLECKYGKRPFVKIPARYHQKPLPIPQFKWCGNWRKQIDKKRLPRIITTWTKNQLQSQKQALLFFPHIRYMEKALPLFKQFHPDIESVHAEDPDRKEKVEKMRQGKIPILLTTTILERGVTFPNIDVAVLGAEDDIFTESALVQISGRVGRSAEFPSGSLIFFHYGRTRAMIRALVHIDEMNREARKKGLIT